MKKKIAEMDAAIQDKTDLIIGVGSGVINDLCKYVSSNHLLQEKYGCFVVVIKFYWMIN